MNLELWGGVECTVNRIGARSFDQLKRSGHDSRLSDLDRFASLGLKTLRYPVLWERVQPGNPDDHDWAWSDERLGRLKELGIRPIVGLLHHGSGPSWTDLLDPKFPAKFARFALAVARRYPWVDAYVPVNEPLTTARFSGLYGHWYPHRKDNPSFVSALLNQIEAVGLGMRAIRSIQPRAELVQTEDLGKTFSTKLMKYQADFENQRRWITFDLLAGGFVKGHPLWNFMLESGANRQQIDRLAENPCPADICGANYYVTSERFLDHYLEAYPTEMHGGNGIHSYVDTDAVRVRPEGLMGIGSLLREMWSRYQSPMAVTEAHIGCTREEQIRWLMEIWNECRDLIQDGIDCTAVTAWALLGAYDWSSLVTQERGEYEPGAYDIRNAEPQPTAVAAVIRTLAHGKSFTSPVLETPGWWRRPERLQAHLRLPSSSDDLTSGSPLLLIGAENVFARTFLQICENRGLNCVLLSDEEEGLLKESSLDLALEQHKPWGVINASDFSLAQRPGNDEHILSLMSRCLCGAAKLCAAAGIPYLSLSNGLAYSAPSITHYLDSVPPRAFYFSAEERGLDLGPMSLSDICHTVLNSFIDAQSGVAQLERIESYEPAVFDSSEASFPPDFTLASREASG